MEMEGEVFGQILLSGSWIFGQTFLWWKVSSNIMAMESEIFGQISLSGSCSNFLCGKHCRTAASTCPLYNRPILMMMLMMMLMIAMMMVVVMIIIITIVVAHDEIVMMMKIKYYDFDCIFIEWTRSIPTAQELSSTIFPGFFGCQVSMSSYFISSYWWFGPC